MELLGAILPILLIQLPFAIMAGALAKRLGGNTFVWAALSIVPVFGWLFQPYVVYRIVTAILDRLDEIRLKTTF
ncbi:MAG: hypothetical protein HKM95_18245 [Inquilinus sp.]|nr:hypothetical protein [Inquilinus sp.]